MGPTQGRRGSPRTTSSVPWTSDPRERVVRRGGRGAALAQAPQRPARALLRVVVTSEPIRLSGTPIGDLAGFRLLRPLAG